jgi:bacillithiol system protein YtxJ
MKNTYNVHTIEEWNELRPKISSLPYGLIIFKFSPTCPISRSVERGFDAWYAQLPEKSVVLCIRIDVVNSRALSQQIAKELNIPHESPQVIWIAADETIHWHDSHWAITSEALNTQFQKLKVPKVS